ncbi:MAG: choice-of-anchor L domain-containing protein [Bacteroidota bacterium]
MDNLLGSDCVDVSNISSPFNGNIDGLTSIGAFNRGTSNFPFSDGIILSSGDISSAGNGIIEPPLNDGSTGWGTDPDLESTLGVTNTLNATTLEFEFISAANTIQFNYILASEEYQQEYPCFYSDGFAILLKKVGPSNSFENIALIPGTSDAVNTFNIRDTIEGFCDASYEEYFEGYNLGDTNYNGRTTVLTATASIEPNVPYRIKFIIADDANPAFDSAVFLQANSFNATVDLGPDISTCASQVTLNADIGNSLSQFDWFLDGNPFASTDDPELMVNTSGEYRVVVSSPIGGGTCVIEDSIIISIDQQQSPADISDMVVCDDSSNDGIENFNLNDKIAELLAAVFLSDYDIQFFESDSDAQNNINPISPNYQNSSSPQTIYVRMEDIFNGCLAFPSFDLVVNPLPTPINLPPYSLCQNQTEDGFTPINLSIFDNQLSEGNNNITVSYHATLSDANSGNSPLTIPYNNPNISETIYVRLENSSTGCINTTSLFLNFSSNLPIPTEGAFIDLCLNESEEFGIFDLNSVINGLLNGLTGVTVSFHENFSDAQQGINPIPNPANYENTTPDFQTVYIRFEDNSSQCPTITSLELHVNLLDNSFPDDFVSDLCDDPSNDGIASFDLLNVKNEVTRGLIDLDIELYETVSDLNNQMNSLDDSVPFEVTGGQEIIYGEINSASCSTTVEITLLINDATIVNPVSIDYCDDEVNDGITEIILAELDEPTLQGINPGSVNYYLTQEDADNNENEIGGTLINTSNPQQLFVRITDSQTNCSALTQIEITIINRPQINTPTPLTSCDLDGDALNVVDLNSKIPEMTSTPGQISFEYFESFENAENQSSPIADPSNYETATTTLYARGQDNITNCYDIVSLEIIVNTIPIISDVPIFINCEAGNAQTSDFILSEKVNEILNGQTGKIVLFYENEIDAQSGYAAIDSSIPYQNTSNPQTIFFRIENTTDNNCFEVGSMSLEVRTAPIFNVPIDEFICDTNSYETVLDLNDKISEISNGSPDALDISFHPSFEDADNDSNPHPLNFTNSINPEPIYVRIENQFGCVTIETFELNVVELPAINPAPDLVACDTNYDGRVFWDLTLVEVEVLNIRQDNIEIAYYSSFEDLEANTNAINDPSNYLNSVAQETVYLQVTNVISNCFAIEPINLLVNLPPPINEFIDYQICESSESTVDLSEIDEIVYSGNGSNVSITYFATIGDAEASNNALADPYSYSNLNEILYVKVEDISTNCAIIHPFELRINPAPLPGPISNLETCDDDFDGIASFNFTDQTEAILNGLDPDEHTVTYYKSQDEAENDTNPLSTTTFCNNGNIVYARLQETLTSCFSIFSFQTIVYPKPDLDIPRQTICLDIGSTIVSAATGIEGETYMWSTGEETASIEIFEVGEYQVTVTTPFGCETTGVFEVIPSQSAFVDIIETIDFSDPNNIIVTVSGSGDYLFRLDDGPLQESGVFENVSLGLHFVTIVDANGCAEVIRPVIVVDAPKFFTPNGDGINERWHITGIETIPGTTVSIFDRFGKNLANLDANTEGWNGRYNGNNMPATDYWFTANVVKNNERFTVNGHFSLKR